MGECVWGGGGKGFAWRPGRPLEIRMEASLDRNGTDSCRNSLQRCRNPGARARRAGGGNFSGVDDQSPLNLRSISGQSPVNLRLRPMSCEASLHVLFP